MIATRRSSFNCFVAPWRPAKGAAGTELADLEFRAHCLEPVPHEWRSGAMKEYAKQRQAAGESAANTWLRKTSDRLRNLRLPPLSPRPMTTSARRRTAARSRPSSVGVPKGNP